MKSQIVNLRGDNGGNGKNALNIGNALSSLKKQSKWIVKIPFFFFFKKSVTVTAESIMLTDSGDLLIIEDSDKAHYTAFSRGQWHRFYMDE